MKELAAGDAIEIIADSPLALDTISRWIQNHRHKLAEVAEVGPRQWQITIDKSA